MQQRTLHCLCMYCSEMHILCMPPSNVNINNRQYMRACRNQQWDEQKLAKTEEDKVLADRQPIDEPKTPFLRRESVGGHVEDVDGHSNDKPYILGICMHLYTHTFTGYRFHLAIH